MREYDLSSQEGVALMCMAEALLRIPDAATRDALIADKIGGSEWRAHVGQSPSPFVNAATWGLLITGQLVSAVDETGLAAALTRLIARSGAPVIRASVDTAMRVMGEQFVCGQTIGAAIAHARPFEARGFRYSYDMLGEAATTAEDAERYLAAYETALKAIGAASAGRGVYEGPGLSVKLSALHPRYSRSQRRRAFEELYPRLKRLAVMAREFDVGLNIDAEESERLDISLDLLEALCRDPAMEGWNGVGFVVQAYQKRAVAVIDWIVELARATRRRIMLRLVKGAYWDSEIKRAQVEGLEGFSVFTRKIHTDVSYIACARRLLDAPDAVFPQFATHNALTLATIHAMAGANFYAGQYEFQCLHGMGEPLYNQIVGAGREARPCRVYAPVGSHETLLAYLVRRLLENGANTSFVNRIADASVSIDALIADPVAAASAIAPVGAPHPKIALPRDLYAPARPNSAGLDLSNEARLAALARMARQERANRMARRRRGRRSAADRQSRRFRRRRRRGRRRRAGRRRARLRRGGEGRPGLGGARAGRTRGDPRRRRGALPEQGRRTRRADLFAKRARRCPMRSATCARRSTSCATTELASPAAISPTRPIRRSEPSSASARGTSRSRSSPARSPPRSPPATRSSPSRPRRRRSSPPPPCG